MVDIMSQTDPLFLNNVIEQEWLSLTKQLTILKTLYWKNDRDFESGLAVNINHNILRCLRKLGSWLLQEADMVDCRKDPLQTF